MMRLWFVLLIAALAACSRSEPPADAPPPVEVLPPDALAPGGLDAAGEVSDVGSVAGQPEADAAPESERDLGAELAKAVGDPVDCVKDYRPSSPKTIEVDVTAVVRPTGLVIEPTAAGTGLSVNDRRCIAERVGAVTLAPLSGQVSVPVSARLSLAYQPEVIEEADVGGPAPDLPDVVEPLPKKTPIPPSGIPIEGPKGDPIEGPKGDPIEGPKGVPVEGPKPQPIDGYEVDQDAERWTD
ncbi:MAG: hypothetical protein AAF436_15060 [Myxococcota bacterium]